VLWLIAQFPSSSPADTTTDDPGQMYEIDLHAPNRSESCDAAVGKEAHYDIIEGPELSVDHTLITLTVIGGSWHILGEVCTLEFYRELYSSAEQFEALWGRLQSLQHGAPMPAHIPPRPPRTSSLQLLRAVVGALLHCEAFQRHVKDGVFALEPHTLGEAALAGEQFGGQSFAACVAAATSSIKIGGLVRRYVYRIVHALAQLPPGTFDASGRSLPAPGFDATEAALALLRDALQAYSRGSLSTVVGAAEQWMGAADAAVLLITCLDLDTSPWFAAAAVQSNTLGALSIWLAHLGHHTLPETHSHYVCCQWIRQMVINRSAARMLLSLEQQSRSVSVSGGAEQTPRPRYVNAEPMLRLDAPLVSRCSVRRTSAVT
jgi:hypothetical protein